ncbi:MAG: hypothetical protein ABIP74_03750, partial [Candidatus Saccharimonas sp.]
RKLYEGTDYSQHGTQYSLYVVTLDHRPDITMSWEHSAHAWLDRTEFLAKARAAKDTYMQMVYDKLK